MDKDILSKHCYYSCLAFMKVRVPLEKRDTNFICNILDQTRVHARHEKALLSLCSGVQVDKSSSLDEGQEKMDKILKLINNVPKLKEILDTIEGQNMSGNNYTMRLLIEDIMKPFHDFRDDLAEVRSFENQKFDLEEIFYSLIDETGLTFKAGMIVQATVARVIS